MQHNAARFLNATHEIIRFRILSGFLKFEWGSELYRIGFLSKRRVHYASLPGTPSGTFAIGGSVTAIGKAPTDWGPRLSGITWFRGLGFRVQGFRV